MPIVASIKAITQAVQYSIKESEKGYGLVVAVSQLVAFTHGSRDIVDHAIAVFALHLARYVIVGT